MLNSILIISSFVVTMALLITCLYQMVMTKKELMHLKSKFSQNTIAMRVLLKNIEAIEGKLQNQSQILTQIDQQTIPSSQSQQQIEGQYERAKRILKNGSEEDIDNLHSCDMTKEEIELLTDLMQAGDFNH